jgi:UPF0042 nucleotide-binding protein
LREHTGRDAVVSDYVLSRTGARDYLDTCCRLIELTAEGYRQEGKRYLTVAVGCTGGRHRSVAMSEALGPLLGERGGVGPEPVRVVHRDVERE